jgi:hypothetical protein
MDRYTKGLLYGRAAFPSSIQRYATTLNPKPSLLSTRRCTRAPQGAPCFGCQCACCTETEGDHKEGRRRFACASQSHCNETEQHLGHSAEHEDDHERTQGPFGPRTFWFVGRPRVNPEPFSLVDNLCQFGKVFLNGLSGHKTPNSPRYMTFTLQPTYKALKPGGSSPRHE